MTVVPKLCLHLLSLKDPGAYLHTPCNRDGEQLGHQDFKIQKSLGATEIQYFCLIQAFLQLLGFMNSIFTDSAYILHTLLSQVIMSFQLQPLIIHYTPGETPGDCQLQEGRGFVWFLLCIVLSTKDTKAHCRHLINIRWMNIPPFIFGALINSFLMQFLAEVLYIQVISKSGPLLHLSHPSFHIMLISNLELNVFSSHTLLTISVLVSPCPSTWDPESQGYNPESFSSLDNYLPLM